MTFKKIVSKSIALVLVGVTIITPTLNTVSAMEINRKNISKNISQSTTIYTKKTLDNIAQKYGFKQKNSLLKTSMPYITVNSEEELESVLSSLNNFVDELNSKEQVLEFDNEKTKATKQAKFSKGLGLTIGNWSSAKFNVYSSLEVNNKKITKVNYSDQSLTGFTLGISLTKGSTSCKVSTDKTKATVRGTGTINVNILFEGIGTIFSKDYTVSGIYKAS